MNYYSFLDSSNIFGSKYVVKILTGLPKGLVKRTFLIPVLTNAVLDESIFEDKTETVLFELASF